jgi:AcrR family transcriptional regulator
MSSASEARPSRKSDILRCFSELVAERGYDEVSLRDIAAELEMSKGTILHHFGTKERLLEQVHSDYMSRRLGEARKILDELDAPVDQVRALIYQLMYAQAEDRAATVAFAREIVRFASDELMSDVRSMRDEYSTLLQNAIARGVESGQLAAADPALVALQIFGMCNWSWTWYRPDGPSSSEEIAEIFCATLFDGLLTNRRTRRRSDIADVVRSIMRETAD